MLELYLTFNNIVISSIWAGFSYISYKIYCGFVLTIECKSRARLEGKSAVITGATSGIGKETAMDLARRGAKVIIGARNMEKAAEVVKEIIEETGNPNVKALHLDLESLKSVVKFATEVKENEDRLDILVNNAGCGFVPPNMTEDGYEVVFQTNYLSHFLLVFLLLDLLKKSTPSRIVNVSSIAYTWTLGIKFADLFHTETPPLQYHFQVYAQSKLAQILFTRKLAEELKDSGVSVYCVNPGMVETSFYDNLEETLPLLHKFFVKPIHKIFGATARQGAQTSIYCAVTEFIEEESGKYFWFCRPSFFWPQARNKTAMSRLWRISLDMIKPFVNSPEDVIKQKLN